MSLDSSRRSPRVGKLGVCACAQGWKSSRTEISLHLPRFVGKWVLMVDAGSLDVLFESRTLSAPKLLKRSTRI